MLKRADWRALQWSAKDASEPEQLELPFEYPRGGFRYEFFL